jgi:hypothetical protein
MYDYYSAFNSAIKEENISDANASLVKELSNILVKDKTDFVDMLNGSGVKSDIGMSDAELIDLFVDNAPTNKKLILGASLLINVHNKQMGFDGEDEMDDEAVKQSYFTMKSCFIESDEEHSNLIPFGLIAKAVGKGVNAVKERKSAKEQMKAEALRRREEQRKKAEEERKKKQTKMFIYGGIAIVGVLIIGVVLIRRK